MRLRAARRPRVLITAIAVGSMALSTAVAGAVVHTSAARSAAAPAKLILTVPTTAQAGHSVVAVVEAVDKQGFAVPTYRGKLTFTSTDPHAKLPKSYTFTAHDAGLHKFPITFRRLGHDTLKVVDHAKHPLAAKRSVTGRPRGTKTSVSCPHLVISTAKATCTATVLDNAHHGAVRPAGKVSFVLDPSQTFRSKAGSCTLPAKGTARCAVKLSSRFTGAHPVAATFVPAHSDKHQAGSTGSFTFLDCFYRWYADSTAGSDHATGDCNHPFATLKKAVGASKSGDTIRLSPDEDFAAGSDPLVVPANVTITGQFTTLDGRFPATISGNVSMSNDKSTLDRLGIRGTVTSSGTGNVLSSVSFVPAAGDDSATCLTIILSTTTVTHSSIQECDTNVAIVGTGDGIFTDDLLGHGGTYDMTVETDSKADLNGGNTLSCGGSADLLTAATADIDASNDIWDNATPTYATSAPPAGVDIYNTGTGMVTTTGATADSNACS